MFPGTALLVMSAWCLGVLNSHRRFFLSYVSPVLWNTAIIAAAIVAGRRLAGYDGDIATWLAWGAVIGSSAQLLVQLPTVYRLLRGLAPSVDTKHPGVRTTLRTFVPVVIGRGSVQISAYVDEILASFLGKGIVAAMFNAQTLYLLPVSLFGMAISAAELPEMASATGDADARSAHLQKRLASSLRRLVFLVVPSAVAFVAIGGSLVALLFETGRFGARETEVVWVILAGSALGLTASAQGRLLASAFYALGDARPPLHAALVRVALGGITGFLVVFPLRDAAGYSAAWGAFGVTAAASLVAWIEFELLRRWLGARIGRVPVPGKLLAGALAASILAGALGHGAGYLATELGAKAWQAALVAIPVFGAVYLGAMALARVPEAAGITRRVLRSRR
jgi:putative peptidoglycan lipid II flippase